MADFSKQFSERNKIEHDIEQLASALQEKKHELEGIPERGEDKEMLRKVIGERISEVAAQSVAVSAVPDDDMPDDLPAYAALAPQNVQAAVHHLVERALEGGIDKAAAEAKKHKAFVVDAFHDALVDRMYDELKARKILK